MNATLPIDGADAAHPLTSAVPAAAEQKRHSATVRITRYRYRGVIGIPSPWPSTR